MMSLKMIVSTKGLTELVFKSRHWKQNLAPRWGKYLLNASCASELLHCSQEVC